MELWQQQLKQCITTPAQLAEHFPVDVAALEAVVERYPMRITPHYLGLIREIGDPIWKQCVPDPAELLADGLPADPLNEEHLSPVPSIVHRYPDRALFLVSNVCAAYCRFCTRKRKVGCGGHSVSFGEILDGIDYIGRNPRIKDVLLSGGDPLLMSDRMLGDILARLRRIPHVEVIRIGSRVPVTLPERITEELCRTLRQFHPLYLNTHFNHPAELTAAAAEACGRLADAGIALGNQTVLLAGVNDEPAVMAELVRGLMRIRVRPYYLHQMDLTAGTGHFRSRLERGLEILAALGGEVSGMAIPQYVVDLPGGKGKVPLVPGYLERLGESALLRAPDGERIVYPNGD
ncbi:lysine 2,3-aminomutase [Desulfuromonas versatilis]|uniref:Lysine 2,3-aminomutase n=1 Tax=Desulfuromonas versatilis TaxID=2802975 RepID=A0ABM8HZL2_9BACT|nr:KamA family radical SAM protein [Desulfuromonas versatilis]BCR06050.1 lysine 2,3-aminomutase [Desulfuromonas versatilis]